MFIYGGSSNAQAISAQFIEINLSNMSHTMLNNKNSPGPLSKHKACILQHRFYIVGGQTPIGQCNRIHYFDFSNSQWQTLPQNASYPRPHDGHALTPVDKGSFAIFGGFHETSLSNHLLLYQLETNTYRLLSERGGPSPREGSTLNYMCGKYFVFGGSDYIQRFD